MTGRLHRRTRHSGRLLAAALMLGWAAALVLGWALPASAADWQITPRAGISQSFTDNVRSTESNRESDFFTTFRAGIGAVADGPRLQFNLDYDAFYEKYFDETDLDGFRHSLLGAATAELYQDLFFFDARAAVSQEQLNRTGQVAAGNRNTGSNQTTTINYSLSPYLRADLGPAGDAELRYLFGQVFFEETDTGDAGNLPEDSTIHAVSGYTGTLDRATRFGWRIGASQEYFRRGDGSDIDRASAVLETRYQLRRSIALLATLGYDDLDDERALNENDGLFWLAGFRLIPGPRTDLTIQYGHRYDDEIYLGQLLYRLTARNSLLASYQQTVETPQQNLSQNLNRLTVNQDGTLIDQQTGLPADPNNPLFALVDESFKVKRATASLVGSRGRIDYALGGFFSERESTATGLEDTVWGVNGRLARRLRRHLTAGITGAYSESSGTANDDELIQGGLFAVYEFTPTLVGDLNYSYLHRSLERGGTIIENLITIGLRKDF